MKTPRHHADLVRESFSPRADAYLKSAVHASGPDLDRLDALLRGHAQAELLDLGCGGGHVSYLAAARVRRVTACDMSENMLETVRRAAAERGLDNIATRQGTAESLPFADASFDLVASRYSAHHWHDVGLGLREVRRVLKPGGMLLLSDVASPGHPVPDIYLQTVEMLRDPSHVRDYSPGEWLEFVGQAGLRAEELTSFRLRLEFSSWIARMRTPEVRAQAIRSLQETASDEVRAHFAIEPDGSFTVDCLFLTAVKAR